MNYKVLEEFAALEAHIPLPAPVLLLSKIFKANGYVLYGVGGAVRDFLMADGPYEPKDVDLATDAPPTKVEDILTKAGIRNFEKGESFGVWVAHINGEDFEIATFRIDVGSSDGRHPDSVIWANAKSDYKRRDLTINALFYDIPISEDQPGRIIDYGMGMGFDHVKEKIICVVGDPFDRFNEDKLRILRFIRFFSRYQTSNIGYYLDKRTCDAMERYRDLRQNGVTGPRIQQEFLSGLIKSKNTISYLESYIHLDLMKVVFPTLDVDIAPVYHLNSKVKNPVMILALMFLNQSPEQVRSELNKLNWPNEISDEVAFLLNAFNATKLLFSPIVMARLAIEMVRKPNRRELVSLVESNLDFGRLKIVRSLWKHLSQYEPLVISGEEIQKQFDIAPGPEMGRKQRELQVKHYNDAYCNFIN